MGGWNAEMMGIIERVMPEGSPEPVAPYSHATAWGPLLFVTGQMPIDVATGEYVRGSFAEQTDACMRNLETILNAGNSGWEQVLHARLFITDFERYDEVNEAYARWFEAGKLPARTCVGVTGLAGGAGVEIDLLAARTV
jgi:2-iminobutanoate/2-iminopropanoate deaminase